MDKEINSSERNGYDLQIVSLDRFAKYQTFVLISINAIHTLVLLYLKYISVQYKLLILLQ